MAVDPGARTLYVTNRDDGTMSVIDGSTNTVTATLPVGAIRRWRWIRDAHRLRHQLRPGNRSRQVSVVADQRRGRPTVPVGALVMP